MADEGLVDLGEVPVLETTRKELRSGLIMVRRRTPMRDGRYLYYYDFVRDEPGAPSSGQDAASAGGASAGDK